MSWVLLILAVLVAVFVWWWFYRSQRPYYHRGIGTDRFGWLLKGLTDTMTDESLLIVEHEASGKFIQFMKGANPSGSYVGLAFPDAPWSREYFELLGKALREEGFTTAVSETGDDKVRRFLEVEFEGSPEEQIELALRAAATAMRVMHLGKDEKFSAHFRGELDTRSVLEQSIRGIRAVRGPRSRPAPNGRPTEP